jgi:hypothetical protein
MLETRVISQSRFLGLIAMILAVAVFRLIPHPPNFAPVEAMALFGGACFATKRAAFLVPLAAMLLSDMAIGILSGDLSLGFHQTLPVVYGSFALVVCVGFCLRRRRKALPIAGAILVSSVMFFVLTNFGVWATGDLYPKTLDGLVACYVAAIPFFQNALLGNAVYTTILFGGLAFAERGLRRLREPVLVRSR